MCKFARSYLASSMGIANNIRRIKEEVSDEIKIIAVSKYKSAEEIRTAFDAGQRRFGENKVQELVLKQPLLSKEIEWHFLGHLQTNKVKYIAPFIHMIHSVDSLKLLQEINKEGKKSNRVIHCLLQFHIATEETKFGLDMQKAIEILESPEFQPMRHICLAGIMGMASFTNDTYLIKTEFKKLKCCFIELKEKYFREDESFCEISMGMSGDYQLAIQEGSTMVRIGTIIFGTR